MSERINFLPATRQLVAERAGYECSMPTCRQRTSGPDAGTALASRTGKGCHIYSAAENGPRGQGGLSDEELSSPDNCIWLCSEHGEMIDKNRGKGHPAEELIAFKALQEARISRERQGLYIPVGWIFELIIRKSPIFQNDQVLRLAKLNLLVGENMTGKTAISEWLAGFFDSSFLKRWLRQHVKDLNLEMTFLNPSSHHLHLEINAQNSLSYRIDEKQVPFNPTTLRIIRLGEIRFRGDDEDDEAAIARILKMPPAIIRNLMEEVHRFRHAKVRNLRFEQDAETGTRRLYADVAGTVPGLPLHALAGREVERIFIELATAAARVSGVHTPTLLILDGCPSIVFEGFFDFYSHHFLDPENHFQTLMCIPTRSINPDSIRWNGWQIVHTEGKDPNVKLQTGFDTSKSH
jgi:hypothetical protein